ncbi:hypothetical protein [Methylophilus aquaticus]|uniref:Uncharacterized protein n=1 Tax=Methylophilus aquaticus TaxID=1971610 RepID=A0ABT9JVF5_9PROT|nr:hypothetical protein [Methylophilus aquaticus]MDP8568576.1 hypothetical protein [Methylophilus aquaticus]
MQKLIYFIHLLCFLFALQSSAAEPAVTTTLLQTGAIAVTLSNAVDDALSADFGDASCCVDMLEIAEVDVDKIICPAFNYPLPHSTHLKPEFPISDYLYQLSFLLDRPPQSI